MLDDDLIRKEVEKMRDKNDILSKFCYIEVKDVSKIPVEEFNKNPKMNNDNSIYIIDYRYGIETKIDKESKMLLFPCDNADFYYAEPLKRNIVYRFTIPENQVKFFYNSENYQYGNKKSLEEIKKEHEVTIKGNKVDLKLDFSTIPIGDENYKLLIIINENQNHMYIKFGQIINEVRIFSYGPITLLDQENGKKIELHNLNDYYAMKNNDHRGSVLLND